MEPIRTAWIALGANIGDRRYALIRAVNWLTKVAEDHTIRTSRVFETLPVGPIRQDCFFNQVVCLRTHLGADALLRFFQEVERWLGRRQRPSMHPREIDIDLLFLGDLSINRPDLRLPHAGWSCRSFVLVPLLDLEPDFQCPFTGIRAQDILERHCPAWDSETWPVNTGESVPV